MVICLFKLGIRMNKWTIFSSWFVMFILSFTPLFFNIESISSVRDTYTNTLYFVFASFGIILSIFTFLSSKDWGKRDFAIVSGISILLLLIFQIFEVVNGGAEDPPALDWWFGFWIAAYFPFIVMSFKRIIQDYRFITRASFTIGMGITSLAAVVSVPVFTYFLSSTNLPMFELISFSIILILDMISFVLFNILLVLYFRMKYGYQWLFMAIGFAILIFRDLAGVYYFVLGGEIYPQIIINVLNLFFFSTMITALLTFFDQSFSMRPIKDIEAESEYYKSRYEELDYLSKDLITVTELWFHDLKNDINVLENSILLFEENHKIEFMDIIKKRLELMTERQEGFQSVSILDSLKVQPINLAIIEGLDRAFNSVKIDIPNKPPLVKANKLLFPIVLNVVQNAFQHGGKDIQVSIEVKEEEDAVLIQIKDNGKGIPEEDKKKIFNKDYRTTKTDSSGIGLYLVKLATQKFGATIEVEDNEPKGTIFTLRFQKIKSSD